jgi:lysophospholipase L1-like esterase
LDIFEFIALSFYMNFFRQFITRIVTITAIVILAVVVYCTWSTSYFKLARDFSNIEIQQPQMPAINCWGDSLTEGVAGNGETYPKALKRMIAFQLTANGYSKSVPIIRNLGISGETSLEIACRGGMTMRTQSPIHINQKNYRQVFKITADHGKSVSILRLGDTGVNPVKIGAVVGRLSRIDAGNHYTFTPSYVRYQDTIPQNSKVVTYSASHYRSAIPIVFIGQNGGYSNTADLIRQQKAIIHNQIGAEHQYIVVGLHTGTAKQRAALEKKMQQTYGDHYINLRKILSKNGTKIVGIKATKEDRRMMRAGMVPASLLADDHLHFNAKGYRTVAKVIYARMTALNIIRYPLGAQSIVKNYYE